MIWLFLKQNDEFFFSRKMIIKLVYMLIASAAIIMNLARKKYCNEVAVSAQRPGTYSLCSAKIKTM